MKSRDFVYWLQGYFEILAPAQNCGSLTAEQVHVIRNHLAMVFKHEIDPEGGDSILQEALNNLHKRPSPPFLPEVPATSIGDPNVLIRC